MLKIQNPLGEDTSIMRTIALPSMLEILSRNNAYHNKAAKLYEVAKVYLPVEGEKLPREPKMLMFGTYGSGETFFTLKGELEAIFAGLRLKKVDYPPRRTTPATIPAAAPSSVWTARTSASWARCIPWSPRIMAWTARSTAPS